MVLLHEKGALILLKKVRVSLPSFGLFLASAEAFFSYQIVIITKLLVHCKERSSHQEPSKKQVFCKNISALHC